jgi:hypothetical protein
MPKFPVFFPRIFENRTCQNGWKDKKDVFVFWDPPSILNVCLRDNPVDDISMWRKLERPDTQGTRAGWGAAQIEVKTWGGSQNQDQSSRSPSTASVLSARLLGIERSLKTVCHRNRGPLSCPFASLNPFRRFDWTSNHRRSEKPMVLLFLFGNLLVVHVIYM